ncbi:Wadjet anti-phage system protein JetD domain-containing protein [Parahaliea aestuarii]|uniref:Wadjet protein JetD C-terminal domain-containing protein n=1 Tax=Parahaliea aestuarii TaxID=1852021 RepID=A0A5C8ZYB6_9GAMM|nr:Wadjet anti-phage system protein JetD domain-containing protein [Parahaliea aestuarii]TXS93496.1 hypothetical protein FVW59_06605 [Parahaliea aestuarii]
MKAPGWLVEEQWLQTLLHWFLDRLEEPRERAVTRRIKPSTVPALFRFAEDTRYRWRLIEQLASDYPVFSIHYDHRIARHQERYENAQLRLNPEAEALLREWLARPLLDPLRQAWRAALAEHPDAFADGGDALLANPPAYPGWEPADLAAAFAGVGQHLTGKLTLREIAARCFRGDSKFLDQRLELLHKLYGQRVLAILPRPLLLTAWAPVGFTRLLVVENQDSFLRLADAPPPGYALLYSGGFRASAERLGSEHTRFAFLPGSDSESFERLWLSDELPAAFWGDLDFAGMGILKGLRQSLPRLTAWRPGYAPMLEQLQKQGGHVPEQAGKTRQIDPGETGCAYADSTLLPALRQYGTFIDQEGFLVTSGNRLGN